MWEYYEGAKAPDWFIAFTPLTNILSFSNKNPTHQLMNASVLQIFHTQSRQDKSVVEKSTQPSSFTKHYFDTRIPQELPVSLFIKTLLSLLSPQRTGFVLPNSNWRKTGQSWSKHRLSKQNLCQCWLKGNNDMTTQREQTCSFFTFLNCNLSTLLA